MKWFCNTLLTDQLSDALLPFYCCRDVVSEDSQTVPGFTEEILIVSSSTSGEFLKTNGESDVNSGKIFTVK